MSSDLTQRCELRLHVVDLLHRIAVAADLAADAELPTAYRPHFTTDAVWEMIDDATGYAERREGIDDLMDGITRRRATGRNGPATGVRHHLTTTTVSSIDDTTCVAISHFLVTRPDGSAPPSAGTYTDRLVDVGDGWQIDHRLVIIGRPAGSASATSPS